MSQRFNTAAVRSNPAAAAAVGETPTWLSQWDSETGGAFMRSFPLARRPAALELGERVELPIGALRLVETGRAAGGIVSGVQITTAGDGYDAAPTVTFADPTSGVTATGTTVIAGGAVTQVIITNPGSGYGTTAPTVTFSGGTPTNAAVGTVLLNGAVTETVAAAQLAGETSADLYYQLHNGDPGTAGTANAISGIDRIEQPSTNWTAAA